MTKKIKNSIIPTLLVVVMLAAIGFNNLVPVMAAGPLAVDLGTAGNFSILAKTAITTTGATAIVGNIGVSPAAATTMTGFSLVMDASNVFSTSAQVDGKVYASNYAIPTPSSMTTAVSAMEAAYTDAATRPLPTDTEVGAGNLSSTTLPFAPGIYKWSSNVTITDNITLNGSASDVWIFQIAGDLNLASGGNVASGTQILLTGGAKAENVYWQVAGPGTGVTLGTYSTFNGNILSLKQIVMQTGAVFHGRALSQTQVTLDANNVSSNPASLYIIKSIINTGGGSAVLSDFSLHVKKAGVDVIGSPAIGTSTPGRFYSLPVDTYIVSEDANSSYTKSFSGDCDASGNITLVNGIAKTCTIINTYIIPTPVSSGGGPAPVLPVIGVSKTSNPLTLSNSGLVTYNYAVWNVGGQQALASVVVSDDKCGPVTLVSGDLNKNWKIEPGEIWNYTCATTLSKTTTNTVTAIAKSDDPYQQTTTAKAVATVTVGNQITVASSTTPVVALTTTSVTTTSVTTIKPAISITKKSNRLTPMAFGGGNVIYTYTVKNPGLVALNNVYVNDDKCKAVSYVSGDTNKNLLLDVAESWIYTCQQKIVTSTKNIATAKGEANGSTVFAYASTTVLVLVPGLPNTGVSDFVKTIPWGSILLAGLLLLALFFVMMIIKRRKV